MSVSVFFLFNLLLNWVYWCHILRKVEMPKTIYDHQPCGNKQNMLELKREIIISIIFKSQNSIISIYSIISLNPPKNSSKFTSCQYIQIHLYSSLPLRPSSVILVSDERNKFGQNPHTLSHSCQPLSQIDLWKQRRVKSFCMCVCKNSPNNNSPKPLHTALVMSHV